MGFNRAENNEEMKNTTKEFIEQYNADLQTLEGAAGPVTEIALVVTEEPDGTLRLDGGGYDGPQWFADWLSLGTQVWEEFDGRGEAQGYWHVENNVRKFVHIEEMDEDAVLDMLIGIDGFDTMTEEQQNAISAARAWLTFDSN